MAPRDESGKLDDTKLKTSNGYSAPALEKGLDILELISLAPEGLSQLQIAKKLERTPTEIFRMLNVLERRGYLARDSDSSYQLTLKLFELSHRYPPTKKLLTVALPIMQQLAQQTRQSAHLVVHHQSRVLVIAQVDSPEPLSFGVKLGAHFPLHPDRTSARVLTAFETGAMQAHMFEQMMNNASGSITAEQLEDELAVIRKNGFYEFSSRTTAGVVDIGCPIFEHTGSVVAAITVPYLQQSTIKVTVKDACELALKASRAISTGLGCPT